MLKNSKKLTTRILTLLLATSIVFTTVAFELPEAYAASTGSDVEASGLEYNGYPVYRSYINYTYDKEKYSFMRLCTCYTDGYFVDSPKKTNEHMATTSLMFSIEMDCNRILSGSLLKNFGFGNVSSRDLSGTPTEETIGAAIASKKLFKGTSDECLLIPIIVRGGGYYAEWGSNFMLGESGDAQGFSEASNKVLSFANNYLKKNSYDTEKVKFWVMGYSRAGGTANLVGKALSDKYGMNNVYTYTFEAPQSACASKTALAKYSNIKNYRNANDMIPSFYPESLGFGLYGDIIEFADTTKSDYEKYEAKMEENFALIDNHEEVYLDPKDFRWAKLSLSMDMDSLTNMVSSLSNGGSLFTVGGKGTVKELSKKFSAMSRTTIFKSRSDYVNTIPDRVKSASELMGVEACTKQMAMSKFGATAYANQTEFFAAFAGMEFSPSLNDANLYYVAQFLTTMETDETSKDYSYAKLVKYLWGYVYPAANATLTRAELNKFKSAFPMLVYILGEIISADDGEALGTYLYNRTMTEQSHYEKRNFCWLRAYDSFYDYEQLKITGASALRETEIYADSGSEFDNTSITVYNTEGKEVARIDNGIVQAAAERSVYIASTKDGNGKNREFSIHTPAYDYTIEITSTSAQAKKINVIRRNLYNYSEIKNANIIDMQGNRSKQESLTLYSGQKATLYVNSGGTKIEKTVSVESVSSNASCVIEKNGKWSELSTAALTCTDDSKNCVSWYINDKQLGSGKTYNYSIGLDSPNLRISATANEEHQTASYIIDKKASFDAAGSKHKECPACHEDLTQAGEEQTIPQANVAYTNVLTYTGRKLAIPTISVDGASEGQYEIKYGKSAKSVGEHIAGIVSLKGTDYSGRKICTYSIVPKGTKLTGISATKDSVTVKWNMQKLQTSGYQLQYAADGDFANNAKLINVKNTKTVSRKIAKLESGTDYSVRIRTYKLVSGEKYYSSWSAAKSIKTKGEKAVDPVGPVVPKTLEKSLPEGYQALEYIESTGTQYIDTGIDSAPGTVITLDLYTPGIAGQYTLSNYATQIGIGHPSYGTASAGRYQFKVVCDGGASIATNLSNGQKQSNHFGSQYYEYSSEPNYLFALSNTNGNPASHYCTCKIYACAMYRKYGDEMVRYFVPVRTSGGEVGLLDMVNEKFYGNSGNGSFTAGPEISNDDVKMEYANPDYEPAEVEKTLPDQYQAVEYIEGTGTQYIDLDVQAYEDTSTEICIVPDPNYASDNGIWGTYWSGNAQFLMLYQGIYRWHNGGNAVGTEAPLAKETTIKTDSTGVTINGEYYACNSWDYFSSNDIRLYGAYGTSTNLGHFKTKYFKIWESGKIVRYLVPCYEKSSNAAGLYDLVNDKFYTNGGSGNFNVGKDVDNSTIKGSYAKKEEESAETGQLPEADIFSFKVNEDGSAKSVTSRGSFDLVGVGNLNTEETEQGLATLFDGETYYKFNEFESYYPEMKKEVTMEFLGSFDYVTGQYCIDFMSNFEGGGIGFECVDGNFGFEAYTDGGYRRTAKAYINPSELVHIVGVYDGTYIKLYVNGKLCSERRVRGNLTFPAATTAHYLCLGGDSTGDGTASSLFAGSMLAANVYSKALTAKQIEALYESYDL